MNSQLLDVEDLMDKAVDIRKKLCHLANSMGVIHIGGMLSSVDIVVALFYRFLNCDISNLADESRDKFVLSKGHCGVMLYVVFCDLGLYTWEQVFGDYNKLGSSFGQHPNRKKNKGFEVSTGSLGHGLSVSVGMALANRSNNTTSRVYCLTGDGEMQEGSNWEAIMYAGSHKLSNLVCIVDFNQCTSAFRYGDNLVLDWEKAFEAFGWGVTQINGADMHEIVRAFDSLPEVDFSKESKPIAIISKTKKGQNVDFMEGPAWHYGSMDDKMYNEAIVSIDKHRYGEVKCSENI